jgi:HEAT repeat protein
MTSTMKLKYTILLFLLCSLFQIGHAQDNRTTETKVADVLALFPANQKTDADRLYTELLNLNDEGLSLVTGRVLPNGKEEGIPARYAVSLLTRHAGTKQEKARIENAYLKALENSSDTEVKAYFVDNLKIVGSNTSIKALGARINEEGLAQQAISALVSIHTPEAGTALQSALESNPNSKALARLIEAMGELKRQQALGTLTNYATHSDPVIRKHALWSLALISDASSYQTVLQQAQAVQFKNDPAEAIQALVEYIHQLSAKGNKELVLQASQELLSNTLDPKQQHFRLAALKAITQASPDEASKILVKELNRFDAGYQREVLKVASQHLKDESAMKQWLKVYKKSSNLQAEICPCWQKRTEMTSSSKRRWCQRLNRRIRQ